MEKLNNGITISVPDPFLKREHKAWKAFLAALADKAGGFTIAVVTGGYIRQDNGKLDLEKVHRVTALYADEKAAAVTAVVDSMVALLVQFGEECVLVERTGKVRAELRFRDDVDTVITGPSATGKFTAMWTQDAEVRKGVKGCPAGTGDSPNAAIADLQAHTHYVA